jgi:hypothetical protein
MLPGTEEELPFLWRLARELGTGVQFLYTFYTEAHEKKEPFTDCLGGEAYQRLVAKIIAAMRPLTSQAPRPQMLSSSSREGMKGGTVSWCVESVTTGSPQRAKTLNRFSSTGIRSTTPPVRAAMTGSRQAMASSATKPKVSVVEGKMKASAER